MKQPIISVGSWFLLPEYLIWTPTRPPAEGRFSLKTGRRPAIVADSDATKGFTLLPRSTSGRSDVRDACYHERHHHRPAYPGCCIDKDGWIVNFPVTINPAALAAHSVRCREPDDTGLLERVERWIGDGL